MKIAKAVITLAGPRQRLLPVQTLIDQEGVPRSVLAMLLEEVVRAGVDEVCLVVAPGDQEQYSKAAGDHAGRLTFVLQPQPSGYGDAVYRAAEFVGRSPFLHLVGDHVYVGCGSERCARLLLQTAEAEQCSVSAVTTTRESDLARFGAVAGPPLQGRQRMYRIERVAEKPTPTEAEQSLVVPGLRAGHYLCFFGMHALTATVIDILGEQLRSAAEPAKVTLSHALAELARREQYLAMESSDRRYDLGDRYGLFTAQAALSLGGRDRDQVLTRIVELLGATA